MPTVQMIHVGFGGTEFSGVRPAPLLPDPNHGALLGQRFRRLLLDTPLHFLADLEIQAYPLIRLQWVALCRTAGLLMLRSG